MSSDIVELTRQFCQMLNRRFVIEANEKTGNGRQGRGYFGQVAGLTRRESVAAFGRSAVSKQGAGRRAEAGNRNLTWYNKEGPGECGRK